MRNILASGVINPAHVAGGDVIAIPLAFTTDGSNDPTLVDTLKGQVAVTRSSNTYTLTCKFNWYQTQCIQVSWDVAATINCVRSSTASTGVVTLAFSGAITSGRVDVTVWVKPRAL